MMPTHTPRRLRAPVRSVPPLMIAALVLSGVVLAQEARAAQSGEHQMKTNLVVVEQRESAFIVFTGLPANLEEEKLEEIRSKVADREKAQILSWEEFVAGAKGLAESVMLRDDYPKMHVVESLACLVGSQPGAPWGLTWNGGLALSRTAYDHSRRTLESYQKNPRRYRPSDPRRDPVHPRAILAWSVYSGRP